MILVEKWVSIVKPFTLVGHLWQLEDIKSHFGSWNSIAINPDEDLNYPDTTFISV